MLDCGIRSHAGHAREPEIRRAQHTHDNPFDLLIAHPKTHTLDLSRILGHARSLHTRARFQGRKTDPARSNSLRFASPPAGARIRPQARTQARKHARARTYPADAAAHSSSCRLSHHHHHHHHLIGARRRNRVISRDISLTQITCGGFKHACAERQPSRAARSGARSSLGSVTAHACAPILLQGVPFVGQMDRQTDSDDLLAIRDGPIACGRCQHHSSNETP
ncbi:hypothetical protein IE81DRAFT_78808 [Ceraceosorus guamensis]|uniref:Uncharacterized protein n=1 Tax=Ceraceosorus guamensis TaxID=1522189 RepID=A0A316VMH4_9BASI|nr:hypothetical protein IE81DRAFT_78808 [Ceraceosorus guamensis]PWN38747.1 hypothetical protein IE81DRAFT_78808 [Ceraceosorus guamensis]